MEAWERAGRDQRRQTGSGSGMAEEAGTGSSGGPPAAVTPVALPEEVTAGQRAALHRAAEALGLAHVSVGEGPARRLLLGPQQSQLRKL